MATALLSTWPHHRGLSPPPGVSVTLEGGGAPETTFTDPKGEFHFLNLAPGVHTVTASLQGFSTVRRENVAVTLGKNTELSIPMALSAVTATVTVSGDTPLLDTRKNESGHTFTQAELAQIPTARDPWVILQQSPSVLVDRNQASLALSADVFNLLNDATILQVQNASGPANQILEIQSPRVIRFGARLTF